MRERREVVDQKIGLEHRLENASLTHITPPQKKEIVLSLFDSGVDVDTVD